MEELFKIIALSGLIGTIIVLALIIISKDKNLKGNTAFTDNLITNWEKMNDSSIAYSDMLKLENRELRDELKQLTKDRDWKLSCFLFSEKQREDLWTRYKKDTSYLKSELNKLKEG